MATASSLDWHLIHFGDVPGWFGAVGTVAAVSIALYQIHRERSIREADKREAVTADRRRQAQQLNAWYAGDEMDTGETLMQVTNRSHEPVHEAVAWLVIVQGAGPKRGEDYGALHGSGSSGYDDFRVFLTIPPGKWSVTFASNWRGMHRQPGVEIAFTDSKGHHWIRRATGELEEISTPPLDHYGIARPPSYVLLSSASERNMPAG